MEYAVEVIIEISLSTVVRFLDDLMAAPLPGSLQLYRFLYLAELIFNRLYTDRDYEEQESYLMDKIVECFLRLLEAGSMDGLPREETDIKMDLYQMQRFTQAVQRKLDELWG